MKRFLMAFTLMLPLLANAANDIQQDNLFPTVEFETSKGTLVVELDRSRAPLTVDNFLRYAVDGAYDNTIFHRVIADFVVQGGGYDPDLNDVPERDQLVNESGSGLTNSLGTIAMARSNEPHSATNQFYFNLNDNYNLDPSSRRWGYAVFGEITEGEDILQQLGAVATKFSAELGAPNVPVEPLILKKVTLRPE
ncbi:peptidylprolyl isomerase [Ferrimonas lipolytica]|uniref:Peptidyl-prolyl cis-trans isomerase n=1 Tax=Ferrimonas lipolytica TaxID=2724191 RepID=A0A6H1U990_9GAMM|nr:peptidylprolyl isomerase [Ferrimonas lipolytica]QIZ75594.1 peptidyl-prolyl cis-trans isomerase [Ferrimonas lipolytica]